MGTRWYHVAAAVLLAAGTVRAEPGLLAAAGNEAADAVLIGEAGQIYGRLEGSWRRRGGGVAVTLTSVWADGPGNVWAIGAAAPVFRHDGAAWLTVTGTRGGPARLSVPGSPLPVVAVGKRLFAGGGGQLAKMAAAPGLPSAIWARTPEDVMVVVDGKLLRLARDWKLIRTPGEEAIVALCGHGPAGAVAVGAAGSLFAVAGGRLRRLGQGSYQRCGASRSRVVVIGAGGALAEVTGAGIAPLPALPDEVAFVLPFPAGGELALSAAGRVYLRDRGAWTEEPIDGAPPVTIQSQAGAPAVIPAPPASR